MLEVRELRKVFSRGARPALDDVSFSVSKGEIFGLLGHNGAGKSTAVGIMLGMVRPNGGEVLVGGTSVQADRERALRKVGAIFESPAFYDYLSGWRNLKILAGYGGWWEENRVRETVALVGLESAIHQPVRMYSHGMRQRLALAQALLPEPELLLLDEPTDGLDPEGITEFREFVRTLRDERGLTVLLNSHLLSEVEQLCDRVAILRQGKLVYQGGGTDMESNVLLVRLDVDDERKAADVATGLGGVRSAGEVSLWEFAKEFDTSLLSDALIAEGIKLRQLRIEEHSLEQLYLKFSRSQGAGDGLKEVGASASSREGNP